MTWVWKGCLQNVLGWLLVVAEAGTAPSPVLAACLPGSWGRPGCEWPCKLSPGCTATPRCRQTEMAWQLWDLACPSLPSQDKALGRLGPTQKAVAAPTRMPGCSGRQGGSRGSQLPSLCRDTPPPGCHRQGHRQHPVCFGGPASRAFFWTAPSLEERPEKLRGSGLISEWDCPPLGLARRGPGTPTSAAAAGPGSWHQGAHLSSLRLALDPKPQGLAKALPEVLCREDH